MNNERIYSIFALSLGLFGFLAAGKDSPIPSDDKGKGSPTSVLNFQSGSFSSPRPISSVKHAVLQLMPLDEVGIGQAFINIMHTYALGIPGFPSQGPNGTILWTKTGYNGPLTDHDQVSTRLRQLNGGFIPLNNSSRQEIVAQVIAWALEKRLNHYAIEMITKEIMNWIILPASLVQLSRDLEIAALSAEKFTVHEYSHLDTLSGYIKQIVLIYTQKF